VNDKREGLWRKYDLQSDLIAVENYKYGGKDGVSQYYTRYGELLKEERWHAYNPDAPYDTIAVYGTGSNEIISYKIVKAEQYSVKDGNWTYYDPATGRIVKTEKYDRNRLIQEPKKEIVTDEPKKVAKPAEVLEYEKKNSGKKKVKVRDGETR
jgi:antitoxin component YwqK of YwqJK toxin-antitoxin module